MASQSDDVARIRAWLDNAKADAEKRGGVLKAITMKVVDIELLLSLTPSPVGGRFIERLRAEAGMAHGDGAEDSLEWAAANEIERLQSTLVRCREELLGHPTVANVPNALNAIDAALQSKDRETGR